MKVRELIEALQAQPPESDVVLDNECGCQSGIAASVFIPNVIGNPYGRHTGIDNDKDVIISTEKKSCKTAL